MDRTQSGIEWVDGLRKYTLISTTVTKIVITFNTNVSSKYLAIKGIVEDVGGNIFDTNNKKTTIESNIAAVNVIFSPVKIAT